MGDIGRNKVNLQDNTPPRSHSRHISSNSELKRANQVPSDSEKSTPGEIQNA